MTDEEQEEQNIERPDVVFKEDSRLHFGPFDSVKQAKRWIEDTKGLLEYYYTGRGFPGRNDNFRDVVLEFSDPRCTSFTSSALYVDMFIRRKVFHCPSPKCKEYFFDRFELSRHQDKADHSKPGTVEYTPDARTKRTWDEEGNIIEESY